MDYKKMWVELKEKIQKNSEEDLDNLKWLFEIIINTMNRLEEKYDERYICIKNKDCVIEEDEKALIKGKKYEVVDQDQDYICISGENDEWVYLSYDEFDEYFEERR